jgi:hypothetical protein
MHTLISTSRSVRDISFKGNLLHFVWGGPNFGIWETDNVGVANPFFGSKVFKSVKIQWTENARQMVLRSTQELCIYYPNEALLNALLPKYPICVTQNKN